MKKLCKICNVEKDITEFPKRKDSKDGYRNECKKCHNEKRKKLYLERIEYERQYRKEYYANNLEKIKSQKKKYYDSNKEYFNDLNKKYRELHKKELNEYAKQYRQEHQKEITQKKKEKRHNDKKYYFEVYLRNKINNYLNRKGKIIKKDKTQEILGCSYIEFKNFIENKFVDGMTWENRGKWHLDHIIPLATAKNYEDLIKLNHYTNFQPLWAYDNYKKGKKVGDVV